MKAEC